MSEHVFALAVRHCAVLSDMLCGANVGQEEGAGWGGMWAKGCLFILESLMIYFFVVLLDVLHVYCIDGLSHGIHYMMIVTP